MGNLKSGHRVGGLDLGFKLAIVKTSAPGRVDKVRNPRESVVGRHHGTPGYLPLKALLQKPGGPTERGIKYDPRERFHLSEGGVWFPKEKQGEKETVSKNTSRRIRLVLNTTNRPL